MTTDAPDVSYLSPNDHRKFWRRGDEAIQTISLDQCWSGVCVVLGDSGGVDKLSLGAEMREMYMFARTHCRVGTWGVGRIDYSSTMRETYDLARTHCRVSLRLCTTVHRRETFSFFVYDD